MGWHHAAVEVCLRLEGVVSRDSVGNLVENFFSGHIYQKRGLVGVPPARSSRRQISQGALLRFLRQYIFGEYRAVVVEVSS